MKDLLLKYLVITLGLTVAEATAMLTDEAVESGDLLKDLTTKHAAKVAEDKTENFNQGEQKARKEVLTKFEDDLRTEFGIKSKTKGIDLVKEVITAKTPDPKNPEAISEDVVKAHPAFINREKALLKEVSDAKEETAAKVKEVEDGYTKKETLKKASDLGLSEFRKLKPVLSADATKAAKQERLLTKALEESGYDFKIQDDGNVTLMKDGKRAEDAHGNPIKYADFIKTTADDLGFDFKVAEERGSPGGGNGTGGKQNEGDKQAAKYSGTMPKTEDDLVKIITDDSIPLEQRNEVQAFFDASQKTAE
jgi:hypothetical protein